MVSKVQTALVNKEGMNDLRPKTRYTLHIFTLYICKLQQDASPKKMIQFGLKKQMYCYYQTSSHTY